MFKIALLAVPAMLLALSACSTNPVDQAAQCAQARQALAVAQAVLAALPPTIPAHTRANAEMAVASAQTLVGSLCAGVPGVLAMAIPGPAPE
jgi:hypothetical protein